MKLKAMVVGLFQGEFEDESGNKQPYYQLECIDQDAEQKEVIRLKVAKDKLDIARPLVGKIVPLVVGVRLSKLVFSHVDAVAAAAPGEKKAA